MKDSSLQKDYQFQSFGEVVEFINEIGMIPELENDHPGVFIKKNKVTLCLKNQQEVIITHHLANNKMDKTRRNEPGEIIVQVLTPRELKVLQLVADGLTTKEIADRLHTSSRTAETHRANLMKKMKTKNTAVLVKLAVKHGIIW